MIRIKDKLTKVKDLFFNFNIEMLITNRKKEEVLCRHCGRTENNGIRCMGICVADNEY